MSPSDPPCCAPAQKTNPFYEEWWFLVVIALVGLIFILLLVFVLIIRGQSKKYSKKSDSGECGGWGQDPPAPLGASWGSLPAFGVWREWWEPPFQPTSGTAPAEPQRHPITMLWLPGERWELQMK